MRTVLIRQALKRLMAHPGYFRLSVSARLQTVYFYIFEVK